MVIPVFLRYICSLTSTINHNTNFTYETFPLILYFFLLKQKTKRVVTIMIVKRVGMHSSIIHLQILCKNKLLDDDRPFHSHQ